MAKKFIFLQYSKKAKGYVLLGENEDSIQTEHESCNAKFIQKDFL